MPSPPASVLPSADGRCSYFLMLRARVVQDEDLQREGFNGPPVTELRMQVVGGAGGTPAPQHVLAQGVEHGNAAGQEDGRQSTGTHADAACCSGIHHIPALTHALTVL